MKEFEKMPLSAHGCMAIGTKKDLERMEDYSKTFPIDVKQINRKNFTGKLVVFPYGTQAYKRLIAHAVRILEEMGYKEFEMYEIKNCLGIGGNNTEISQSNEALVFVGGAYPDEL